VAELTGLGLAGQAVNLEMEVTHVRKTKDDKEEPLPIKLIEAENKDNPKGTKRQEIDLGKTLVLKPPAEVRFDKSSRPRAVVEFQLDAAAFAAAAKKDLGDPDYASKKWELGETKEDSELKFQVRVPTDKREGLLEKFHLSSKVDVKVIKKPTRVLLFASAATKDYQFLRTLLMREVEKKRVELAIHLQLPPGQMTRKTGVVQDVPPERLLGSFPDSFNTKKNDLYDLASYDVVVCFDPDWRRLSAEQIKLLRNWAAKGGGIIYLGPHFNTVNLVFPPEGDDPAKYQPILELLPVIPGDRRDYLSRKTDMPWDLDFTDASPEMEFLRLDEEMDESRFKEDWKEFFYGVGPDKTDKPQRGFFSFYPVKSVKLGSVVAARYADPGVKVIEDRKEKLHPFIVLSPDANERVVWIGSNETWRLREYKEGYHERFWTKLLRYAASKSQGEFARRIRLELGKVFTANQPIEVEAKIDGPSGSPLPRSSKPQIFVKFPPGVSEKELRQPVLMAHRPGPQEGWFGGRFRLRSPGEYELQLKVPDPTDPKGETILDTETKKFTVKEANPELDDTRPDFDRMYRLASEADNVLLRMTEAERQELLKRLRPPERRGANPERGELKDDKPRLYFDLKNAGLIPSCMVSDVQKQTSRGKVDDLWDDGWPIYHFSDSKRPPIRLSKVLVVVVGLLSVEWLIRKLLRLA
jgi:hypothetical protein